MDDWMPITAFGAQRRSDRNVPGFRAWEMPSGHLVVVRPGFALLGRRLADRSVETYAVPLSENA